MQKCELIADCSERVISCHNVEHQVVDRCFLREPMDCEHPALYRRWATTADGVHELLDQGNTYDYCAKCEEEAENAKATV